MGASGEAADFHPMGCQPSTAAASLDPGPPGTSVATGMRCSSSRRWATIDLVCSQVLRDLFFPPV